VRSNFGLIIAGVLVALVSVTISAYAQTPAEPQQPAPKRMLTAVSHN
jgi:hypothetical protein